MRYRAAIHNRNPFNRFKPPSWRMNSMALTAYKKRSMTCTCTCIFLQATVGTGGIDATVFSCTGQLQTPSAKYVHCLRVLLCTMILSCGNPHRWFNMTGPFVLASTGFGSNSGNASKLGRYPSGQNFPRHSSSTYPESFLDSHCQGVAETTSNTSPAYEPQTWTQEFADLQGRVNRYHGYTHRVFKIPHRGGLEADGQPSPTARGRVNLKAPSPVSPSAKLSVKGGEQGAELASPRQEGVQ